MKFLLSRRFLQDYRRLPRLVREAVDKQLRMLAENPDHPSLDIKKMQDPRDIWRCKVTSSHRLTFQMIGDTCILRRAGPHDVERKP
jgi:mRNA-degrading endonuclease RelE of RelBE toxin-antitoxin system